jgi:hypothetical protein
MEQELRVPPFGAEAVMTLDLRNSSFVLEVPGGTAPLSLGAFSEGSGLVDGATTRSAAFKRGIASAEALLAIQAAGARSTVLVTMRDERGSAVRRWKLSGARITKYVGPVLSAKGTDVAVEELVLAADSISIS